FRDGDDARARDVLGRITGVVGGGASNGEKREPECESMHHARSELQRACRRGLHVFAGKPACRCISRLDRRSSNRRAREPRQSFRSLSEAQTSASASPFHAWPLPETSSLKCASSPGFRGALLKVTFPLR